MDPVQCKKCKAVNAGESNFCQLCGANLKGGGHSGPGHTFIIKVPPDKYMDVYMNWQPDILYVINMIKPDEQKKSGLFAGMMKEMERKRSLEEFRTQIFPLALEEQLHRQTGFVVDYSRIGTLKETKTALGSRVIDMYANDGKLIMSVGGSKKEKFDFALEAQAHGFKVEYLA